MLLITYFVIGFILSLTLLDLSDTNKSQRLRASAILIWITLCWLPLVLLLGYLELRKHFYNLVRSSKFPPFSKPIDGLIEIVKTIVCLTDVV
jgi:hypothetical protein